MLCSLAKPFHCLIHILRGEITIGVYMAQGDLSVTAAANLNIHLHWLVLDGVAWRGSVQQGLSAAGGTLGFSILGRAADKRYRSCATRESGVCLRKYVN